MSINPASQSERLEDSRTRFLSSLDTAKGELADHQDFISYWSAVAVEAQHSEDLGQLDKWVKDLRKDRDKIEMLAERKQSEASQDASAAALLQLLRQILAMLDDLYDRIRKYFTVLNDQIAWWMLLAPPGTKSKPLPKGIQDGIKGKDKKKEDTVRRQNLAKDQEKKKPTKQKAP